MTAENLKNWIKEKLELGEDQIAVGCIDGNKEQFIGVYDGKSSGGQRMCIGGRSNTRYQERAFTILVHWSSSPVAAFAKAQEVYNLFFGLSGADMDGTAVIAADPGGQPEWAGRDTRRICEYVIRLKLTYERTRENAN